MGGGVGKGGWGAERGRQQVRPIKMPPSLSLLSSLGSPREFMWWQTIPTPHLSQTHTHTAVFPLLKWLTGRHPADDIFLNERCRRSKSFDRWRTRVRARVFKSRHVGLSLFPTSEWSLGRCLILIFRSLLISFLLLSATSSPAHCPLPRLNHWSLSITYLYSSPNLSHHTHFLTFFHGGSQGSVISVDRALMQLLSELYWDSLYWPDYIRPCYNLGQCGPHIHLSKTGCDSCFTCCITDFKTSEKSWFKKLNSTSVYFNPINICYNVNDFFFKICNFVNSPSYPYNNYVCLVKKFPRLSGAAFFAISFLCLTWQVK